ncbi:hypothetical protein [Asaia krungthepensis]|uniref:Uncharacterized protein n=1 Tax=Asaia krungthepensis NRIC 0535 TaxID=1307925 RepID=A0ABQ0Q0Y9_9PROT|nr:hypothetical protein [Asaia krungthepensis]GBQ86486.1 hypothetical protein AA0535_1033 [Asaia krungthepensis NRIC 0535]
MRLRLSTRLRHGRVIFLTGLASWGTLMPQAAGARARIAAPAPVYAGRWPGPAPMPDEQLEVTAKRHKVLDPATDTPGTVVKPFDSSMTLPWLGKISISNGETPGRDPNTGASLKPFGEAYENSSPVSHGLAALGQVGFRSHP